MQAYKIDVCADMTVSFTDDQGTLKFGFELVSIEKKSLILYSVPTESSPRDIMETRHSRARIEIGVQSAVKYLENLGYGVTILHY